MSRRAESKINEKLHNMQEVIFGGTQTRTTA
jgi:hypothetical protein